MTFDIFYCVCFSLLETLFIRSRHENLNKNIAKMINDVDSLERKVWKLLFALHQFHQKFSVYVSEMPSAFILILNFITYNQKLLTSHWVYGGKHQVHHEDLLNFHENACNKIKL